MVALGPTDALAVGEYQGVNAQKTLTLHWDGHTWEKVGSRTPPPNQRPYLLSVDGVAPNDVWAVGYRFDAGTVLIEHWNGKRWKVTYELGGLDTPILYGVSATSANDAWAVGTVRIGQFSIVEHWDGQKWTRLSP